ncbi:RNA-binding protein 39-like [Salvia divinorum]|uniref:RNA-binding protein 39-like n=1 Tax=Salvia divinorum TaxID=28513 RepID=A0ABD1IK70_SALDI
MLMAKLDSSVIAPSVVGTLGVPALNGAAPTQQAITMPINPTAVLPNAVLPPQAVMHITLTNEDDKVMQYVFRCLSPCLNPKLLLICSVLV